MEHEQKTSIIDSPRTKDQADLFGIEKYQKALVEFINYADTPITIALQGEWGSGKTSLMNTLQDELCDCESSLYYKVWINTWHYSLLRQTNEVIIKILEGIIQQISEYLKEEDIWKDRKEKFKKILINLGKQSGKFVAKQVVDKVGGNTEYVDELFESSSTSGAEISELKSEISKSIQEIIEKYKKKKGFVFFIDDLDRIDPPVAVQILEILKNIFDLKNCVFILAIDYDVVIKGLQPKFGELTDKNEREFRSFFDKIIQLPFSMPVTSYQIDKFLIDVLSKINFLNGNEKNNIELTENLSEFANLSVGNNPRSLKRLTNTLSLIQLINKQQGNIEKQEEYEKQINFGLVCIQIAYPYVYNNLTQEPDFKSWNDKIAQKLKLEPLNEKEISRLDSTEEFNDEWEKILFRMCQKETHSSNRAFQISQLLNKIAKLVPENNELGMIIDKLIELSSVTNIQAFDKTKVIDTRISEYLKTFKNKINPILKQKFKPPLNQVELQVKKIISNMVLKFCDADWLYFVNINPYKVGNNTMVKIGGEYGICKSINDNIDTDLEKIGKSNLKSEITDSLGKLLEKHEKSFRKIDLWIKPKDKAFYQIYTNSVKDKYYRFRPFFRIQITDMNELISDEFVHKAADLIADLQELLLNTVNINENN
jgi:hypothetical protein